MSPDSAPTVDPTPARVLASQGSSVPAAEDDDNYDHDGIESADFGDFDYDAVKADDGVELWLVRAPSMVRPDTFSFLPFVLPYSHITFLVAEGEEPAGP